MSIRTCSALLLAVAGLAVAASPAAARKLKPAPPAYAPTLPLPVAPVVPRRVATGAIFDAGDGYAPLYEGWRARRVGDPLTIVLIERTVGSKSAGSNLDSKGSLSITPPSVGPLSLFRPQEATASGTRGFAGTGTADQANSLSGEVSVTVAEVYPNGTMLVQGQKRLTLNRGDEWVRIRGIIRTADVDRDNRVASTRVADADISYTGKGDVARAARQGWLSRFFQVVSPF
ncbi:MAG: flagellar basal body L-ring protein FlgH [Pseudomonadota bacterium]